MRHDKFVSNFSGLTIECHYCGNDMVVRKLESDRIEAKCLVCCKDLDKYYEMSDRIYKMTNNFAKLIKEELTGY